MLYKDIEKLSPSLFKRLTGVKKEVFKIMLDSVTCYKERNRKHKSRGRPPKLTYADKILLLLMYYREYRTMFHIGITYGISESSVSEIITEMESILIRDKRFHLPGKKVLRQADSTYEVILVDVTESPVERPKKNSVEVIQERKNGIRRKRN